MAQKRLEWDRNPATMTLFEEQQTETFRGNHRAEEQKRTWYQAMDKQLFSRNRVHQI
jgi:hypothetical protein